MTNVVLVSLFSAGLAVASLLPQGGTSRPKDPAVRQLSMEFSGTAEIAGAEINILGTVGPSSFFQNLSKIDRAEGVEFVQGTTALKTFPEELTIRVVAVQQVLRVGRGKSVRLDDEVMKKLQFQAEWKRGLTTRSVEHLRIQHVSEVRDTKSSASKGWLYTLVVRDSDVPLTDHLILKIFAPDGRNVARLSAQL